MLSSVLPLSVAANTPPRITGLPSFDAVLGKRVVYTFNATDSDGDFSVALVPINGTRLPVNFNLTISSRGNVNISMLPGNLTTMPVARQPSHYACCQATQPLCMLPGNLTTMPVARQPSHYACCLVT